MLHLSASRAKKVGANKVVAMFFGRIIENSVQLFIFYHQKMKIFIKPLCLLSFVYGALFFY